MSGASGSKVSQPQTAASLSVQQSSYGTPITLLYGTNRVYGNLIWYGAFQAFPQSQQGGKGGTFGGGGKGAGGGQFDYRASIAIALCEGPIYAIGAVYASKQVTSLAEIGNNEILAGIPAQNPWGYLSVYYPQFALSYTDLAYIGFQTFDLGSSTETPQFSFETAGQFIFEGGAAGVGGASPDAVFIDFLSRAGVPSANIDTFTQVASYCQANGFFISPLFDSQQSASDWLKQIIDTLNCEFVWLPSQGIISAVPYGDSAAIGYGATYTPNLTPIYSIGDADYIRDGDEDPITCSRSDLSDTYNQVPIEYVNAADQYNIETFTAFDDSLTDIYGLRIAPTMQAHHITDPNIAQTLATLSLNRGIYVRKNYTFKLPWNYFLLDPMDIIALNDTNMGLVNALARVVSIEEDDKDGTLTFTCEEVPNAIAGSVLNPNFGTTRSTPNYNQAPGSINAPVFFESPLAFLQAQTVEVDIAISALSDLWGGCTVWISTDNVTYQFLQQFNNQSRMGVLTANLPSFTPTAGGNNIDTVDTLSINMSESGGSFNNAATDADAVALNTLCYVDGELIAFGNDVLTGTNAYNLTYLNRGCYGSTISAHTTGANFARFDSAIFRYEADQTRVGSTLYFKFTSFNLWGGALQGLEDVPAYSYKVLGTALLTPLANPTNVFVSYNQFLGNINWTGISDIRTPIYYEVRKGTSFASAQIIEITANTSITIYGTDTYWVTALYFTPLGVPVYSASPVSIAVSTPSIPLNIIDTFDEASTDWKGTCSGGAVLDVTANVIQLAGSGDILSVTDIITLPDVIYYGGVTASGTYTAPAASTVISNYIVNAKVMFNWTLTGENTAGGDIISIADIITTQDITDGVSQALVYAIPQIRLSQNGGVSWSAWQNWTPGFYTFDQLQFQIMIYTLSSQVTAVLSDLSITADLPTATQQGTVNTSSSGPVSVTFTNQFNAVPVVTPTIVNAQAGDLPVMGTPTETGFTIAVVNAGLNVVRTVTWSALAF